MENQVESQDVQDVQTKQAPEKEITFTLTISECNIILAGLEELPHKVSRKVIDKLVQQAQSQMQ